MTYYGAKELARSFRTVRENTIKIAEEIPEEKYDFRPADGCRTVAETLVHVAVMPRVQEQIHAVEHRSTLVGFDFFGLMGKLQAEGKVPRTKAQILELLRTEGERYAKVLEGASEDFLGEPVEYPEGMSPRVKSRFEMLIAPKEHEMHHRAQLMVVERMLGITPHLTRHMEERIAAMRAAQAAQAAR
ncbi:MAG TPA: DinB family protein [Bryobacteraceae bacterium]|nr:DinB family protein [Bryobacteraceae bacterium]